MLLRRQQASQLSWLSGCLQCGQVLAPYDAEDARGLLKAAIRDPDPVVFLENEILYGEAFPVDDKILDKDFVLPIGKVKVTTHSICEHGLALSMCLLCMQCLLF